MLPASKPLHPFRCLINLWLCCRFSHSSGTFMAPCFSSDFCLCPSEIQTGRLDTITVHDFQEIQLVLMHFQTFDYLPFLFQYFMTLLTGYLEKNRGYYSSTCQRLCNEKDSKTHTPGFTFPVVSVLQSLTFRLSYSKADALHSLTLNFYL
jgi:hypothetical protein